VTDEPPRAATAGTPCARPSVIVPAHDEERVIARTLHGLLGTSAVEQGGGPRTAPGPLPFDVVVVCNGCLDSTAERARTVHPAVRVIEIDEASKPAALAAGDASARGYPRVYLDADVELDGSHLLALCAAVRSTGVHAAGPRRTVERADSSWVVRRYYDVWERLPQVVDGLFGRGVLVMDRTGHARVRALPAMMSDDLVAAEAFAPHERVVVEDAVVVVRAPLTTADLLRRRVRVVTGNAQASAAGLRSPASVTSPGTLVALVRERPRSLGAVTVFVAVTLVARLRARRAIRRGDTTTWLRDASSRTGGR